MKKLIFTLCSNNYLAHAFSLGESIMQFDQDIQFVIGLVDKRNPAIDYKKYPTFVVVGYDEIGFSFFEEMIGQYNVIEFNTAVKPYYIDYFFKKYKEEVSVLYIDPDIIFYQSTNSLFKLLEQQSILLTPNLTEVSAQMAPGELASLRHGMFNLGFIGLRRSPESIRFTEWWMNRLRYHCIIDKGRGVFVDQKWVDLAPLYFKDIQISYNKGYNMAWWNLSERNLVEDNGIYSVNDELTPLIFFHFSGYKPNSPYYTGRNNDDPRYTFLGRPELKCIFQDYSTRLIRNGYKELSILKPQLPFGHAKPKPNRGGYKEVLKKWIKRLRSKF
jgi:hypothetical protein